MSITPLAKGTATQTHCSVLDEFLNELPTSVVATRISFRRHSNIPHRRELRTGHLVLLVVVRIVLVIELLDSSDHSVRLASVVLQNDTPDRQRNLSSETLLPLLSQQVEEENVEFLELASRRRAEIARQRGESS